MSKTFTSTNDTDAPIHSLTVGDSDGEVLVRVNFGKVHKGVLIATADAPALALAILEAAGLVRDSCSGDDAEVALEWLHSAVARREREAKEAADREALNHRRDELAIEFGSSDLGYKDTFDSTQRAIDRVIELEGKVKS